MKKTLIIIFLLVLSFQMNGQSVFKYKTTIEYKFRISPLNSGLYGGSLTNLISNGEVIVNYKLGRKVSIGGLAGFGKHKFQQRYTFFDVSGTQQSYDYDLQFNKKSFGFQLSYYFRGNIAPLGSSIGFFYILDDYVVNDYNEFYAYLKREETDDFVTDENIDYLLQFIGVELNYVAMLSEKLPIYFKYGVSLAIPVHSQIVDFTISENGFDRYSDLNSNYDDFNFLLNFKANRILTLNLGIGLLIK